MRVAILSVGTELVRGQVQDTNADLIAGALSRDGHDVSEHVRVADDASQIASAVERLATTHDALVCTGGLGPTSDDLTTVAVARALGVELVRDASSLAAIHERFASSGRTPRPSNDKQADFPKGATVLPNPQGTAPGFVVSLNGAQCFFLPGVPREMELMFEHEVRSRLATKLDTKTIELQLNSFGLAESEVGDRLSGIEDQHQVFLGYRAALPEIQIKVWATGTDDAATLSRVRRAANEVRHKLGDRHVFAEGDTGLAAALGDLLLSRSLSLGLAESCTGGLIAELVTSVPGASRYFTGGVVSYSNSVKTSLLGVDATLLEAHGAVSESAAVAMAQGALAALGCDLALSTTGIAGPDGDSTDKPVGLVHFAVLRKGDTPQVEHKVFSGTRQQIQRRAAFFGLWLARRTLLVDPSSCELAQDLISNE